MQAPSRARAILGTWLALGCACANPSEARRTDSPPPSAPPAVAPPSTNRDRHGDPDVARYIDTLQSPERVADLQVELVIEKLALPADAVVGDLGCGPGVFSCAFAKACPRGIVYASDIEPAQLDRARDRIRAEGLRNVVPVLASTDDPHFPTGRLDVVFIADTYHHLEDRVDYLEQLRSVLKPDGRLVVLEYKPGKIPVGPPPEHKLPAGIMDAEIEEAGYALVERFDTHLWHDFEIWRVQEAPGSAR